MAVQVLTGLPDAEEVPVAVAVADCMAAVVALAGRVFPEVRVLFQLVVHKQQVVQVELLPLAQALLTVSLEH